MEEEETNGPVEDVEEEQEKEQVPEKEQDHEKEQEKEQQEQQEQQKVQKEEEVQEEEVQEELEFEEGEELEEEEEGFEGPEIDYLGIVIPEDEEYVDEFELHATARRESTKRPMTATAIHKYKFIRRLGSLAYLARETNIRQDWRVIKRLKLFEWDLGKIEEMKESLRCRNEMFTHPHLMQMPDMFEADKTIYIVTEYCEGGTLGALVSRAKHYGEYLQEIEVLDWFVQMLRAAQHLHTMGIVHGLIATGNVLLKNNAVKLGETKQGKEFLKNPELFSLVHKEGSDSPCAHSPSDGHVTSAEMTYYSPEVILGDEFTHKADVWSIGCVLYELCSQKRIFAGSSIEAIAQNISAGDLPQFPAYFSLDLANLWRSIMIRNVDDRPTAEEIMAMDFMKEHIEDMDATPQVWDAGKLQTIQEDS